MDVSERNPDVARNLHMVFQLIDDEDFDQARQAITKLTDLFGLDPEITRARSLIKFLEN